MADLSEVDDMVLHFDDQEDLEGKETDSFLGAHEANCVESYQLKQNDGNGFSGKLVNMCSGQKSYQQFGSQGDSLKSSGSNSIKQFFKREFDLMKGQNADGQRKGSYKETTSQNLSQDTQNYEDSNENHSNDLSTNSKDVKLGKFSKF